MKSEHSPDTLIRKATTIAELTRLSGAALIVFALSLFLMQGVDASNDLQRYHLLLLQTSFLGAAGFAVGFLLKEPRGARVFFSLGLIPYRLIWRFWGPWCIQSCLPAISPPIIPTMPTGKPATCLKLLLLLSPV